MADDGSDRSSRRAVTPAGRAQWVGGLVHVFTALGSCCALWSMLAVIQGAYEQAFAWLFVALIIDAVDGTLARAANVEANVPRFSGERLDLVIDFLTYVFVPVLILLHSGALTGWYGQVLAALILMSSLYHFVDTESKTDDNCFVGFPAVWNLVAFCVLAWDLKGTAAAALSTALVALTFVPMRWLHPMRVKWLFAANVTITMAALLAAVWILWTGFPAGRIAGGVVALAAIYYLALALARPLARPPSA